MKVPPSTSTSISVRRKQSIASSGLHTTGSFSLKLVCRDLLAQHLLHHVIGVEPEDPVAGDSGLGDGEAPLLGMTIERPLHNAHIGKAASDGLGLIGRAAIDHHDLPGPREALEGPRDVRRFVERQNDRGYVG
jgi:hypothetical protein